MGRCRRRRGGCGDRMRLPPRLRSLPEVEQPSVRTIHAVLVTFLCVMNR